MTRMPFKDSVTLYEVAYDEDYGNETLSNPHTMDCAFEQRTGFAHSGNQDSVVGSPVLFLPPEDTFLVSVGYRIEGLIAVVNLFDEPVSEQQFRITEAFPVRDTLLRNEVTHVECEMQKVTDFLGIS